LGQKQTYAVQKRDVRFTPESDRESGITHKNHSAKNLKEICEFTTALLRTQRR